jgi:hypothetical protein
MLFARIDAPVEFIDGASLVACGLIVAYEFEVHGKSSYCDIAEAIGSNACINNDSRYAVGLARKPLIWHEPHHDTKQAQHRDKVDEGARARMTRQVLGE